MNFLFDYLNFEYSLTKSKFEQEINLLTHKNIERMTWQEDYKAAMLKEFKREAVIESYETIITRLITLYDFSNTQISGFTNVPEGVIEEIREKLKHMKPVPKTHEEIIYQRKQ